jgi:Ca2+/H+ antiporter
MDLNDFLLQVTQSLAKNTTIAEGIRETLNTFQTRLYALPTHQDLKDLKDECVKMNTRLDAIDRWQKVRLPIVVGLITLIIYGIGFFFTLNRVADMINEKHTTTEQVQPNEKAGPKT